MTKAPKILLYDIETLMNEGFFFSLYDPINPNFIVKEKSILTIAYKFLGDKGKAKGLSIADCVKDGDSFNPHDDKALLEAFSKIVNEADYIVGHYSDKFDNKFLQARVLINELPPIKMPAQIDTYKLVKKHFNLNANRLDYIGKLLGLGGKMPMNYSYWVDCAKGDLKALKKMLAYNKQDVDLLEAIFKKLLPYVETKINRSLFGKTHDLICNCCGGKNLVKDGTKVLKTRKVQYYRCNNCGSVSYNNKEVVE
jgi:DNA polymerase elongation subunit (family B)